MHLACCIASVAFLLVAEQDRSRRVWRRDVAFAAPSGLTIAARCLTQRSASGAVLEWTGDSLACSNSRRVRILWAQFMLSVYATSSRRRTQRSSSGACVQTRRASAFRSGARMLCRPRLLHTRVRCLPDVDSTPLARLAGNYRLALRPQQANPHDEHSASCIRRDRRAADLPGPGARGRNLQRVQPTRPESACLCKARVEYTSDHTAQIDLWLCSSNVQAVSPRDRTGMSFADHGSQMLASVCSSGKVICSRTEASLAAMPVIIQGRSVGVGVGVVGVRRAPCVLPAVSAGMCSLFVVRGAP